MTARAAESILPTEADEIQELTGVLGGEVERSPAETDALASDLLRRMAECRAESNRYKAALALETEQLLDRYAAFFAPLEDRYVMLERAVLALAERANFGKAKSRNVGFGTYGRKQKPERIEVLDDKALLAWAKANYPTMVREIVKEDVPHDNIVARFKETGEIPDGCEYRAPKEEPFAKPIQEHKS